MELQAPALVTDADASQLSAVIDAANGKNLVIQGPPGTGKSQAITNIIANALWQEKTILFVSEKMAALKVVKDRLDNMGLGKFCLEVHSAKASKSLVLKSIRERMESTRTSSRLREVERARDAMQEQRKRLTDYARLMNEEVGATGLTTHQVVWGDFTRSQSPETVPEAAAKFRLPDPLSIDRFKLDELVGAGRALDSLIAPMGEAAAPNQQAWRGIRNQNLNRFDRSNAVELIEKWTEALEALRAVARELEHEIKWGQLSNLSQVREVCEVLSSLPKPSERVQENLLEFISDLGKRNSLGRWAELALRTSQLEAAVEEICRLSYLEEMRSNIPKFLSTATELGMEKTSPDELHRRCEETLAAARALEPVEALIASALAIARRTSERDYKAEAMVAGYLHTVAQLSAGDLIYRSAALTGEQAVDDLTRRGVRVLKEFLE